jgi:hypothetical protein
MNGMSRNLVTSRKVLVLSFAVLASLGFRVATGPGFQPNVPRTWDDQEMSALEVPLADPAGSPKHIPAAYYYRIPVRPIYKSYPIYSPGHEPPGYMDWLKQREPEIVWDDAGHRPRLQTEADWIKAGEMVFDAPTGIDFPAEVEAEAVHSHDSVPIGVATLNEPRDPEWYRQLGTPISKDGIMPFGRYFIRKKGVVEFGAFSCGTCHTRVMPDGTVLKGAQGNLAVSRWQAYDYRAADAKAKDKRQALDFVRLNERFIYGAPWIHPDPLGDIDQISVSEIAARQDSVPAGVHSRHGSGAFSPVHVPDLIGVKDRRYLDRTGLQLHRSIVDLMRYAALNQGADFLSSFGGFVPAAFINSNKMPDPADPVAVGGRYSDEQLYALALYLYSLEPPPNPNKFDALAANGQKVFNRAGCATCHTPPLYTNNKLTPAEGFTPPPGASEKYDILPVSVGTDPDLATKTRRGTGYYKIPSLRGVWYRGMFGHSGWCATLEDWFDPRRILDDYVPTGFKPYGAKTYAVKGHPFGLDLNVEDKNSLIAFLRTL